MEEESEKKGVYSYKVEIFTSASGLVPSDWRGVRLPILLVECAPDFCPLRSGVDERNVDSGADERRLSARELERFAFATGDRDVDAPLSDDEAKRTIERREFFVPRSRQRDAEEVKLGDRDVVQPRETLSSFRPLVFV